jgi:hypothetical protein
MKVIRGMTNLNDGSEATASSVFHLRLSREGLGVDVDTLSLS